MRGYEDNDDDKDDCVCDVSYGDDDDNDDNDDNEDYGDDNG